MVKTSIDRMLLELVPDLTTLLLFVTVFVLTSWLLCIHHTWNMPPGPFQWPIVGCLPQLALHFRDPYGYLRKLGKTYNGMFTLKLGSYYAVFITDYKILKETFVSQAECFSHRPDHYLYQKILSFNNSKGIIAENYGDPWKAKRRFALSALHDMGVGKQSVELNIMTEARVLCEEIAKHYSDHYDPSMLLHMANTNVICSIIFGERFSYDDKRIQCISECSQYVVTNANVFDVGSLFLISQKLPLSSAHREVLTRKQCIASIVQEEIKKHRESFSETCTRDLIDLCLQKQKDSKETDTFSDDSFFEIVFDLLIAGLEATATTLQWALLYMVEYPEVQEKCFQQINKVLGTRYPSLSDHLDLPYVEATLAEIHRASSIAPASDPHAAAYDTTVCGYHIPKGTWVNPMLQAVHLDDKIWDEPNIFRPERFLNDKGLFQKPEHLIPFGIGPRLCPAEPLLRMELFIFFTTLIQLFQFSKASVEQKVDLEPKAGGFVLAPKQQMLSIQKR